MKKLLGFPGIFSNVYYFHEPINCKGITNIFPRYQDMFSKNLYELVLIFCDADRNSEDFQNLCLKIDNLMFGGNNVSKHIVIFSNPVTMQIILSHISKVRLLSSSKAKNEEIIEKLTSVKNYRGHETQIDEILKFVKVSNYQDMKARMSCLTDNLNEVPSSNFYCFLNNLSSDNSNWVEVIKDLTGEY